MLLIWLFFFEKNIICWLQIKVTVSTSLSPLFASFPSTKFPLNQIHGDTNTLPRLLQKAVSLELTPLPVKAQNDGIHS